MVHKYLVNTLHYGTTLNSLQDKKKTTTNKKNKYAAWKSRGIIQLQHIKQMSAFIAFKKLVHKYGTGQESFL